MELKSAVITSSIEASLVGGGTNLTDPSFVGFIPKLAIIESTLSRTNESSDVASGWASRTRAVVAPIDPVLGGAAMGYSMAEWFGSGQTQAWSAISNSGGYSSIRRTSSTTTNQSNDFIHDFIWTFIDGGVRCGGNGSNNLNAGEFICHKIILLGGDGFVGADFDRVNLSLGGSSADVSGMSISPNCVIAMLNTTLAAGDPDTSSFESTVTNNACTSWGIAVKDSSGSILQGSQRVGTVENAAGTTVQASGRSVLGSLSSLQGDVSADNVVTNIELTLNSFTADGLTSSVTSPTSSSLTTQSQALFCALEFHDSVDLNVSLGDFGTTGSNEVVSIVNPAGRHTGVHSCSFNSGSALNGEIPQTAGLNHYSLGTITTSGLLTQFAYGFAYIIGGSGYTPIGDEDWSGTSPYNWWQIKSSDMNWVYDGQAGMQQPVPITYTSSNSYDVSFDPVGINTPDIGNYLAWSFIGDEKAIPNIYQGSTRLTEFKLGDVTPDAGAQGVDLFYSGFGWINEDIPFIPGVIEFEGFNQTTAVRDGFPAMLNGAECPSLIGERVNGTLTLQVRGDQPNDDSVFSELWLDGSNSHLGIPMTRTTANYQPYNDDDTDPITQWSWADPSWIQNTPMQDYTRTFYWRIK